MNEQNQTPETADAPIEAAVKDSASSRLAAVRAPEVLSRLRPGTSVPVAAFNSSL